MKAGAVEDFARKTIEISLAWQCCLLVRPNTATGDTHRLQLRPYSTQYSFTPATRLLHSVDVCISGLTIFLTLTQYDGTRPKVYVGHTNRNASLIHGHPGKQMGCSP